MTYEYALVIGAWGDTISSLNEVKRSGIRKVILASNMTKIKDFLLSQDFIDDVVLIPFSGEVYSFGIDRYGEMPKILSDISTNILNCSYHMTIAHVRYDIIDKLNVSDKSINWAESLDIPKDFILFYPYSLGNSVKLERHWPHWKSLLRYLLEKNKNIVLCGINYDFSEFDIYPNFYDLVNMSDSFEDVFALSLRANKIITTHNGLSLFCAANNLNATIILNANGNSVMNGFNRNTSNSNITKVDCQSTLLEAISILDKKQKNNTIAKILINLPYIDCRDVPELIKKNKKIKPPKNISSIYSEKFNYYILAYIAKHYKKFNYYFEKADIDSNIIKETLTYLENIGVSITTSPIKDADFIWMKEE